MEQIESLKLCCKNYECAIKRSQAERDSLEKQLKLAERRLQKLVKVVTHSTKNHETILKQAKV